MIYEYLCNNCETEFEISHKLGQTKRKCPICKKSTLQKLISSPHFYVRDIKTVGQLADKNSKKLGTYGLQEAQHKFQENQVAAREKARQEVEKKLPKGMTLKRPGKNPLGEMPVDVKKALKQGNNRRIEKYIVEGV